MKPVSLKSVVNEMDAISDEVTAYISLLQGCDTPQGDSGRLVSLPQRGIYNSSFGVQNSPNSVKAPIHSYSKRRVTASS